MSVVNKQIPVSYVREAGCHSRRHAILPQNVKRTAHTTRVSSNRITSFIRVYWGHSYVRIRVSLFLPNFRFL